MPELLSQYLGWQIAILGLGPAWCRDEESYQGLMQEAQEQLQQFCTDGGEVIMPMDAFIITTEKV